MGIYSFERGKVMGERIRFKGENLVDHVVEDEHVFLLQTTGKNGYYFDMGHWVSGNVVLSRSFVEGGSSYPFVKYVDDKRVFLTSWDEVVNSLEYKNLQKNTSGVTGYIIYESVKRRIVTETAFENSERTETSLRIVEEKYATADEIVFSRDYWADYIAIQNEKDKARQEALEDDVEPVNDVVEVTVPPRRRRKRIARLRWWESNALFKG